MAEFNDRTRKKLMVELRQLQDTIAIDMERMAGQMKNKYVHSWDSETFDPKLAQDRIKWLKKFDSKMKNVNREFWALFFKRDMGK
jgi:hypothetical protein